MAINKQELLRELKAEKQVIITALNFGYIVSAQGWVNQFSEFTLTPGTIDLELDGSQVQYVIPKPADLVPLYGNRQFLETASFDLVRVAIRNAVTQYCEKIQGFCEGNSVEKQKWERAPWRPISRLFRNAVSHDFHFDFSVPKSNALRPDVIFKFKNGRVIELKNSLHGKPITGDNFPLTAVFQLLDEMESFVENEL